MFLAHDPYIIEVHLVSSGKKTAIKPMAEAKILIWYRNDLRLHDHEPLYTAVKQVQSTEGQILPFYCFDPRQFGQTSFGFPKTGAFRAQFLLESLADLRRSLRTIESDLIVRQGLPETVIPELVMQLGITAVYYHREVTSEETTVETRLQDALKPLNVACVSFWGHTLFHPDDLPFEIGQVPELFTHFRKAVEKQSKVRPAREAPTRLPALPNVEIGTLPTLADWGLELPQPDDRAVLRFQGGETTGLARVNHYF